MLDAFTADEHVGRVLSAGDPLQLAQLRSRLRRQRAYGVSIRLSLLTAPVVAELRRATDLILAWPVDTESALAQARRVGVTGVISKNLPMLKRLVAQRDRGAVVDFSDGASVVASSSSSSQRWASTSRFKF
jgi:hypothetical protein